MDDSDSTAGGGDRLSKLGDATLGHILSFLAADEAARAAALSRRWRHVFAHVHTVALAEPEPGPDDDDDDCYSGCWSPGFGYDLRCSRNAAAGVDDPPFVNRVSAALLARLRLAGGKAGVPLRAFRVRFETFSRRVNAGLVDMWLWYAVQQAGDELHLDLRLRRDQQVCHRRYSLCRQPPLAAAKKSTPIAAAAVNDEEDGQDPSPNDYVAPRSIFTCAALRTLRLGSCYLDLPSAVSLPSLDTLHLTGVTGRNRAVQRLVSSCPRLATLTLEACAKVTALTVPADARLRTLALRCCHDLAAVVVGDASELRAFEYRGALPAGPSSFLTLHGGSPLTVSSCTLDFCGEEEAAMELAGLVGDMLRLFVCVERLHLTSARLGCGVSQLSPAAFPAFAKLRHVELTGMVPEDDATAVDAVARILERTPNLETLSLFFMPEPEPEAEDKHYGYGHGEELLHGHKLKYDEHAPLAVPEVELPCLRETMKEINLVHYQGGMAQRMLAKLLLCNAPDVREVCAEFASRPLFVQIKLMDQGVGDEQICQHDVLLGIFCAKKKIEASTKSLTDNLIGSSFREYCFVCLHMVSKKI